jgi:hypothetical protein
MTDDGVQANEDIPIDVGAGTVTVPPVAAVMMSSPDNEAEIAFVTPITLVRFVLADGVRVAMATTPSAIVL